jgi:hypothetical protein
VHLRETLLPGAGRDGKIIKIVEPVISAIFAKLDLQPDVASNPTGARRARLLRAERGPRRLSGMVELYIRPMRATE